MFGNSAAEGKPCRFKFGHFYRLTVATRHNSVSEQLSFSNIRAIGQNIRGMNYHGPISG